MQSTFEFAGESGAPALGWRGGAPDREEFERVVLKEIGEQPEALEQCLRGRFDREEADVAFAGMNHLFSHVERLVITAEGTSYHAALVGEYLIEQFARIPVEVEYAGEFRYRNAPLARDTLVISISHSGETPDTLAAQRECQRTGFPVLALCNVAGSSIAREADEVLYTQAAPGASGSAANEFTTQAAVLAMLAVHLGRMRHLSYSHGARLIRELRALPDAVRQTLRCRAKVRRVAERYAGADDVLFLGRHCLYPVALEGARRLKEVGPVHAEACPAAEIGHGPIALVNEETPSVLLVPRGPVFQKALGDLAGIKARRGPVIAVACEGDLDALGEADEVIGVPEVPEYFQPIVAAVPLQLFAYYVGLQRRWNMEESVERAHGVTAGRGLAS